MLMYEFYKAPLPVFSVNVEIIVRNVTISDVQLQNSNLRVWLSANFVYIVISNKKKQHINGQHPAEQAWLLYM